MKATIILLVLSIIILSSCQKDPKHELRVQNDYFITLDLKVDPVDYGLINKGTTSSYRLIDEGIHDLTGKDINGDLILTGSVSVQGKGEHKWTVRISESGNFYISED